MSLSGDNNVVHRTGALKQQNKPFRTGRYRFQHEIKRRTKDQVAEKKHARSLKRLNVTNKQNRINTAIHGVPQLTVIFLNIECEIQSNLSFIGKPLEYLS
ncbi:unnamed protein product [Rotaria sp. Silwood2]|nr:unnamed protein product [Rotaria sp. Silwood2]